MQVHLQRLPDCNLPVVSCHHHMAGSLDLGTVGARDDLLGGWHCQCCVQQARSSGLHAHQHMSCRTGLSLKGCTGALAPAGAGWKQLLPWPCDTHRAHGTGSSVACSRQNLQQIVWPGGGFGHPAEPDLTYLPACAASNCCLCHRWLATQQRQPLCGLLGCCSGPTSYCSAGWATSASTP